MCDAPAATTLPFGGRRPPTPFTAGGQATAERTEQEVLRQLWRIYSEKVLPLERLSHFEHFHADPPWTAEEFEARPQVLLIGQYSTGKTSMIQWLTGVDSPSFDIRPQPSTDKFMAVVHGSDERVVSGNAATVLPQLPYQGLATFGAKFLDSFQALALPADILKKVTFVDTPGVLAGCKQRIGRAYNFTEVCNWMAHRADLVLLTFDAHKLDISDEFEEVMEVLRPYSQKVRCVLNKADQIDASNLVRVNGALHWSVGKVMRTPEIARIYVSSFWDKEYHYKAHENFFNEEREAVLKELHSLPRTATVRKINSLVSRIRKVKTHFCNVSYIRSQLPLLQRLLGCDERLNRWACERLPSLLEEAQRLHSLPSGDMPDIDKFRAQLCTFKDFSRLPSLDSRAVANLDRTVETEIPVLIERVGGVTGIEDGCREPEPSSNGTSGGGLFGIGRRQHRPAPY